MSIKNLVEMIKHNGLLASMAQLEKLYQVAIENEKKLAELESNLAALAAENAGLKDAISCHAAGFTVCEACGEENISGNDDVCRALDETPATDAFLAEVRASAIEHAASERWGSGYVFDELNEIAAQIRKGVQS